MSSPAAIPLSATDGTYSTPPIGASATTDPNSSSSASAVSSSPASTDPAPPLASPSAHHSVSATTSTTAPSSADSALPMDTDERHIEAAAVSASHSAAQTPSLPSPASAAPSSDGANSPPELAPQRQSDTAENKLDSADDEYVMVDKPTDDEMHTETDTRTQPEATADGTAVAEEKQADSGTPPAPSTPHKYSPAKRRSELESDLNLSTTASLSRSGRQRKPPAAFTPFAPSERPQVEQKAGQGTPLADIPNVVRRIDNSKSDSPEVRRFYSLCFPLIRPPPHKSKIKSVLKSFSGLTTDEQRHSAKGKLKRMWKEEKPPVLYKLMLLMDLDFIEGDDRASECYDLIMRWLDRPTASGREFVTVKGKFAEKQSKKKRKRPSSGAKSDGKRKQKADGSDSGSDSSGSSDSDLDSTPRKPKPTSSSSSSKKSSSKSSSKSEGVPKRKTMRTANSFVVFTSAKRDEVRATYPELTAQQTTSKMAHLWRELPADEKEVYELAARRLREDAVREAKEAGSDEEDSGSSKKRKTPAKTSKAGKTSGGKKKPAAKKQKKSAAAASTESKRADSSSSSDSDSEDGSDSSDSSSDQVGSSSGTEDEDDVKDTSGSMNGSSGSGTNNGTVGAEEAKTESSASTPSNAAGGTAMQA